MLVLSEGVALTSEDVETPFELIDSIVMDVLRSEQSADNTESIGLPRVGRRPMRFRLKLRFEMTERITE
jgi:hypothetical protein